MKYQNKLIFYNSTHILTLFFFIIWSNLGYLLWDAKVVLLHLYDETRWHLFLARGPLYWNLLRLFHGQNVHHGLPTSNRLQPIQQHLWLAPQNQLQRTTRRFWRLCPCLIRQILSVTSPTESTAKKASFYAYIVIVI